MKDAVRLDVYLFEKKKDFSRTFYKKFIRKIGVRINGKLVKKPHCVLKEKDVVVVPGAEIDSFLKSLEKDKAFISVAEKNIIFDGKKFIVIDKPPFVTTEELVKGFLPVHRLDKNTSGVLVIAKDPLTQSSLQAQWKARYVKKTYVALLKGKLEPGKGAVEGRIGRSMRNRLKMTISLSSRSREASTGYEVVKYYTDPISGGAYTLIKAFPKTGRTHQIRVHFAAIQHPIIGDHLYGDKKLNAFFEEKFGLKRQFLHAQKLELADPQTGKKKTFTANIPADLQGVLDKLKNV